MKRLILATVLGGMAAFIWGAIAHMATPIASAGFSSLPAEKEATFRRQLAEVVPADGLYFYPWVDPASEESVREAWARQIETGPSGLLVYHPAREGAFSPLLYIRQFGFDLVAALGAALLVSRLRGNRLCRAAGASTMGFFAFLAISAPHWNWYGFPAAFVLAAGVDVVVKSFVLGLVAAVLIPSKSEGTATDRITSA